MAGGGIKVNNITLNGGADGATFVPSVDNDGYLSWSNNKGYPNPATVKVRGTTVVANPTESGTTTLTKLKVDNTVYNVPQGGGGGDFDPTKYYTKTETDGLLNDKQDDLTQTQLNAVNSGITATKVSTYDGYATAINNKVDKVEGKDLSTNDFTNDEKNKLAGIETGAEVNEIDTITAGENVTVSKSGKTVTISATGGGGSGVNVVQTTGQSTTAVMSQKAVTDELNGKASTSYVQGNPLGSGTATLTKLKIDNTIYNIPQGGGGGSGTTVVANPTLTGSETNLSGLQVGDTKYGIKA